MKGESVYFNQSAVFEWNLKRILCACSFLQNIYLKKNP